MSRPYLLILVLCFAQTAAFAQEFTKVWQESLKAFYAEKFDIEVDVTIYQNFMQLEKLHSEKLHYRRNGSSLIITSNHREQVITERCMLITDHSERYMLLGPVLNKKGAQPFISIDSMFAMSREAYTTYGLKPPREITAADGSVIYQFADPGPEYRQAEYWFDKDKKVLQRVLLYPGEQYGEGTGGNSMPVVEYKLKYNPAGTGTELFALDRYLVKTGKTYKPISKYSTYRVINQL